MSMGSASICHKRWNDTRGSVEHGGTNTDSREEVHLLRQMQGALVLFSFGFTHWLKKLCECVRPHSHGRNSLKMSPSWSSQPVNILPHTAEGTLQMRLMFRTSEEEIISDYPVGPHLTPCVLKSRKSFLVTESQRDGARAGLGPTWLVWRMEEGPSNQGMQAASRGWKRQRSRVSSRASRRNTGLLTPWLYPNEILVGLWTPEL